MYLIIIILPLIGSLSCGFLGRWLGQKGANFISCISIILSCLFCILIFYEVGLSNSNCILHLSLWINSGQFKVFWGFLFDSLTVTMLLIITFISMLVHLYSISYMENDPHSPRFMSYLNIFTFFMIFLVSSDNLLQMFLGWEGVGLASYLLINFWYTRLAANQSAIKALLINRIGDFGLILSILLIFYLFQSVEYSVIFSCIPMFHTKNFVLSYYSFNCLNLIGLFLCLGAFGKSAQLGLHSWLPDAMEGPTPVSALIHAATMVTAGVFLIVRFSPLLEYTPFILFILTIIGSLTAFFAAFVGIFQNDIKKIIAYSTCSQLGYMIFICGISYYQISIFHLVNHAFFKALLFLSAGSIIHTLSDEQDIRKMGSLIQCLPLTYSLMFIGSLALIGFPFLTGYYSKDFILELAYISCYSNLSKNYGIFAYWLGSISVIFTSFYSFRLIYMVFLNTPNFSRIYFFNIYESFLMSVPLIILTLSSIFIGYLIKDLFIGVGTDFWKSSIFTLPKHSNFFEAEIISIKWFPLLFSCCGFIFASLLNNYPYYYYNLLFKSKKLIWYFLFSLNKKWYFDNFYNKILIQFSLWFGYSNSFKNLDKGFLELLGPHGLSLIIEPTSKNWMLLQTGQITHYIFFILIGLLISFFIQISSIFFIYFFDKYILYLSFIYLSLFYINEIN